MRQMLVPTKATPPGKVFSESLFSHILTTRKPSRGAALVSVAHGVSHGIKNNQNQAAPRGPNIIVIIFDVSPLATDMSTMAV
jgi:hypothetical protein